MALALDAIFNPHVRFFVGWLNDEAVACGGVALFDDFAEVKRMYLREQARGRGVAQALLQRIEAEAGAAGLTMLRLETGDRQDAALRLYTHAGFRRCNAFGAYASMQPEAIATSVFFEKPPGVAIRSDLLPASAPRSSASTCRAGGWTTRRSAVSNRHGSTRASWCSATWP